MTFSLFPLGSFLLVLDLVWFDIVLLGLGIARWHIRLMSTHTNGFVTENKNFLCHRAMRSTRKKARWHKFVESDLMATLRGRFRSPTLMSCFICGKVRIGEHLI